MGLQFELVHYSCYTNMQVVSAISRGYKYLFTTILMKRYRVFSLLTPCLVLSSLAVAQTPSTASSFPRLVRFSGTASDIKGNPLTGAVGINFLSLLRASRRCIAVAGNPKRASGQ